jgi:alpha-1,3/alpha-1,6-mannosyltransferase
MRVVFLHLDLGIGGAEQLVVNAAISLLRRGHEVTIYTTHHNPSHSFSETVGDGALAEKIRVHGDFLPLHVIGRAAALCATMRMLFLALAVLLNESRTVDAIFLDGR